MEQAPAIVALSIPAFFFLIGVELLVNTIQKKDYYRLNDALASISCGIGSEVVGIFTKAALFLGYVFIYDNWKIYSMPDTIWMWVVLFFGVDFFYYWFHRKSHEVNAIWATHIVHHQSEEYNLTTALRQAWFQSAFSWVFYLPLAFVGFSPYSFLIVKAINLIYQFWIHTKAIDKMGFLEWFMNTPSHHRVHHGKNPKYLDKNYAAVFIIWDRMFGTFQKEEEEPVYGITKAYNSWNPLWTNFHYWGELFRIASKSPSLKNKIKVFLKPPGWHPEELGGFQAAPEVDKATYQKFDAEVPRSAKIYILFQFVPALVVASAFLFLAPSFTSIQKYVLTAVIFLSIANCGALFERKKWAITSEYFKFGLAIVLAMLFKETEAFIQIAGGALGYVIISVAWFTSQLKHFKPGASEPASSEPEISNA